MLHAIVLLWAMDNSANATIVDSTIWGDSGSPEHGALVDWRSNKDDRFGLQVHILLARG